MHGLSPRTWFEIRRFDSHRRTQCSAISDDGHATVIADIGPLMRVGGPRIRLIESLRQMFVLLRDPGPQSEGAIHMHPCALCSCHSTDFPGGIESSRIYVARLNAPN